MTVPTNIILLVHAKARGENLFLTPDIKLTVSHGDV